MDGRVGQGRFRESLEELWSDTCAASRVRRRELLRASHVKSWAASNHRERLDPFNGLLLSVGYDAAFDRLLITFDDTGQVILAPDFNRDEAAQVGISPLARLRSVDPRQRAYLADHRHASKRVHTQSNAAQTSRVRPRMPCSWR